MMKNYINLSRRLAMALLVAVLSLPLGMQALAAVPEITSYYPAKMDEAPQELKANQKAYLYFSNGSQVVSATANVIQNGAKLGTVVYTNPLGGKNVTLDPAKPENAVLLDIKPGEFTFDFCELSYYEDSELVKAEGSFGTVTYMRRQANGKVISETNLAKRTMLSYYSPDEQEGLISFTFDKAIEPDGVNALLVYGMGNVYIETPVDVKVSDDGMSVSVDLRGKCYNVDVLAPGVTFYDDNGNPTDPPTTIALSIERLNCVDGTKIGWTAVSLDEQYSYNLEGRIYCNYNYVDLSFPTPVLERAEFYSSSSPSVRFGKMSETTDMMDLFVLNYESIKRADVKISTNGVTATVPAADVKTVGIVYTVPLPAEVVAAGSKDMVVSLANVEFWTFDGAEHVIAPLYFDSLTPEVVNVAELKRMDEQSDVIFNIIDGLIVTFANNEGYTFAEDATGGIQIVTEDYSKAFDQGVTISGRLVGKYLGYGLLMVDKAASDLHVGSADVKQGADVAIADILGGKVDNMLVTYTLNDSDTVDDMTDEGIILINETLPVMTQFAGEIILPERIKSITGIVYKDVSSGQTMLLIRDADDIEAAPTTGIDSIDTDAATKVYDLRGIRHDAPARGIYIVNGKKTLIR